MLVLFLFRIVEEYKLKRNLMIKNTFCFYTYCSFLVCLNIFSQVEIYKSDIVFEDFQSKELCSSLLVSGNTILFNGDNYKLYAINKGDLKTIREIDIGWKSAKSKLINSELALEWFQKAAKVGSPNAMYYLGMIYK
jgi:hypothetical protein